MRACVTGATGFVGAHVARALVERGEQVRVTYRDERRLERLAALQPDPVRADVLDRAAMRRAARGCELLIHTAGYVASAPAERVWQVNALGPRVAVEAAAAEGVRRVVLTSSVAALGPLAPGEIGSEEQPFRGEGLGLAYVDAKHEGEREALAAGARLGVEVVVVCPAYVLGVPVDRSQPGETSTRLVGNYLRGRLPGVVAGQMSFVDVRDVAAGHLLAADLGAPGERYVLGGHDLDWVELIERVAELSGIRRPLAVLPSGAGAVARAAETLRLPTPIAAEAFLLMGQNWRYSSRKAKRELGYRPRPLQSTLRDTIDWYLELLGAGALSARPTPMSVAAAGMRLAQSTGMLRGVRLVEGITGRRLVVGGEE